MIEWWDYIWFWMLVASPAGLILLLEWIYEKTK
jgi:hypothetical protein